MKKSFAFDYRCILAVLCTLICVVVTAAEIWNAEKTGDLLSAVTIGGALTLVFAFSLITLPKLYVADEEGLSIYYLPFVKEYFRWDEIKRIKLNKHYLKCTPPVKHYITMSNIWGAFQINGCFFVWFNHCGALPRAPQAFEKA